VHSRDSLETYTIFALASSAFRCKRPSEKTLSFASFLTDPFGPPAIQYQPQTVKRVLIPSLGSQCWEFHPSADDNVSCATGIKRLINNFKKPPLSPWTSVRELILKASPVIQRSK
jgi:hypothetical protein